MQQSDTTKRRPRLNRPTPEETFLFTSGAVMAYSWLMLVAFSLMWLWTDTAFAGAMVISSLIALFWVDLRLIRYDRIRKWGS